MFPIAAMDTFSVVAVLVYLLITVYLGWLGYVRTKTAADYLIAGRKTHPVVMALSYGSTFISTSAIVGFGGLAGQFGMSFLWLAFCNIIVGIFIAFVFIAPPTRRMGHHLDAHTFPELLGRRYQSKFIQVFVGLIIFIFMPLYASAVLIGASKYIETQFGIDYGVALMIFTFIIGSYVLVGGLKGVMYTDALQGVIMFVGMLILLFYTYIKVGGVVEAHQRLTDLAPLVPDKLRAIGHQGWTAMPAFGFGSKTYDLWWTIISSLTLGVGIGVLAQPQLIVRFMTVKSKREINRAVPIGGIFILAMVGIAYVVGALTNSYFTQHGTPLPCRVTKMADEAKKEAFVVLMEQKDGVWTDKMKAGKDGKPAPISASVVLTGNSIGTATIQGKDVPVVEGRGISLDYAKGDPELIIPTFIIMALPSWFGVLFLLTLLAAAMSTVSSQFHVVGTSIGRDVYEQFAGSTHTIKVTRTGILVGIAIAVLLSYSAQASTFIARATAIFFGLCAASFLPAFVGGLFFRRMTKAAAIASIFAGFLTSTFWLAFVKAKEAAEIGIVRLVTDGKDSILAGHPNWPVVDSLLIALPVSILVAVVVSMFTQPSSKEHLDKCFA
jgi:SSS family solute:Na+ symporter